MDHPKLDPESTTRPEGEDIASLPAQVEPPQQRYFPKTALKVSPPRKFFDYWRQVWEDEELRQRIVVYIYQVYPIIDFRQTMDPEEAARHPSPVRQVRKVMDEEPWTMEDLGRQLGYGGYHLKLNDTGLRRNQTVCMTDANGEYGVSDAHQYPPMVDPKAIVMDHPMNAAYLKMLRIINRDANFGEPSNNEEDMSSTVETVKTLTQTVESLAEKVSDSAEKRVEEARRKPEVQAQPVSHIAESDRKAADTVAEGAKIGYGMVRDALQMVREVQAKNSDPNIALQIVDKVLEARKETAPVAAAPVQDLTPFFQSMMTMQKEHSESVLAMMRSRVDSLEAEVRSAKEQKPASALDLLKEALGVFKGIKEMVEPERNPVEEAASAVASGGKWYERLAASLLPRALGTVDNIATAFAAKQYNEAVSKTGKGEPMMPGMASQSPVSQSEMGALPAANPAATDPAQQQSAPSPQAQALFREYLGQLGQMENRLLKSFKDGESGADFADLLIEFTDYDTYLSIRDIAQRFVPAEQWAAWSEAQQRTESKNLIGALLRKRPVIWQVAENNPRFERFIDEFLMHDEIRAAEEEPEPSAPAGAPEPVNGPVAKKAKAAKTQ